MKASDLRIGNYLHDRKGNLCKVKELGEGTIYAPALRGAITLIPNEPIPLTEDWLLKFGFEKNRDYKHPFAPIYFIEIKNEWICFLHNCTNRRIKYIHQLQNLFHALTGEELELKQK